jgi:MFS family permease
VRQVRHRLPEARPGASLARDAALTLAERALVQELAQDPAALKLVGANEKAQPARVDWSFTFADPRIDAGKGAEARAVVALGGDEVTSYGRYVEIPEIWQRTERERDGRLSFVKMSITAAVAIAALAALVMAIFSWTHRRCDRRALTGVAAIAFGLMLVTYANAWPTLAMGLDTTEPVASQIGLSAAGMLLGAAIAALLFGLLAGVGAWASERQPPHRLEGDRPSWLLGVAAALAAAGVGAALGGLAPATVPRWPVYPFEALALPALGAAANGAQLFATAGTGLFFMYWLERVTGEWRRHGWLAMVVLVAVVTIVSVVDAPDMLGASVGGIATGIAAAAIVFGLLRFDYRAVPAYMATGIVLHAIAAAVRSGADGAYVRLAIDVVVTVAATWAVTRYLSRARERMAAAASISA